MSYGTVGIQFPLKYRQLLWGVDTGRDSDWAKIKTATAGMSEFAGNVWFCLDGISNHTVFQRERSHADLVEGLGAPFRRVPNHSDKCKDWVKDHAHCIDLWRTLDKECLL